MRDGVGAGKVQLVIGDIWAKPTRFTVLSRAIASLTESIGMQEMQTARRAANKDSRQRTARKLALLGCPGSDPHPQDRNRILPYLRACAF